MTKAEMRLENDIALDDLIDTVGGRIGDRIEMVQGCPPKTSGALFKVDQVGRRSYVVSLESPMTGGGTITRVIARPKSRTELEDCIQGLEWFLDAHYKTIQIDDADSEGYWTNPYDGHRVKVVDVETGRAIQ